MPDRSSPWSRRPRWPIRKNPSTPPPPRDGPPQAPGLLRERTGDGPPQAPGLLGERRGDGPPQATGSTAP
ncbi:hypothetical protein CNO18_06555 [Gordonia sp. 1D]|nr:hypothetical protein CNO18_06555 [Gordonia sp. 1D]